MNHDVASSIQKSYKPLKFGYLDHARENLESKEHSYNDGIEIKHLGLTSDDYIEERLLSYSLDYPTYNNISSIDLTKLNNDVSTCPSEGNSKSIQIKSNFLLLTALLNNKIT